MFLLSLYIYCTSWDCHQYLLTCFNERFTPSCLLSYMSFCKNEPLHPHTNKANWWYMFAFIYKPMLVWTQKKLRTEPKQVGRSKHLNTENSAYLLCTISWTYSFQFVDHKEGNFSYIIDSQSKSQNRRGDSHNHEDSDDLVLGFLSHSLPQSICRRWVSDNWITQLVAIRSSY